MFNRSEGDFYMACSTNDVDLFIDFLKDSGKLATRYKDLAIGISQHHHSLSILKYLYRTAPDKNRFIESLYSDYKKLFEL